MHKMAFNGLFQKPYDWKDNIESLDGRSNLCTYVGQAAS